MYSCRSRKCYHHNTTIFRCYGQNEITRFIRAFIFSIWNKWSASGYSLQQRRSMCFQQDCSSGEAGKLIWIWAMKILWRLKFWYLLSIKYTGVHGWCSSLVYWSKYFPFLINSLTTLSELESCQVDYYNTTIEGIWLKRNKMK